MLRYIVQCNGNIAIVEASEKPKAEQEVSLNQVVSRMVNEILVSEELARSACQAFNRAIDYAKRQEDLALAAMQPEKGCTESNPTKEVKTEKQVPPKSNKDAEQRVAAWYKKAVLDNDAEAQYCLANRYRLGHGLRRNFPAAIYWYKRAANQGYARAQCVLGTSYMFGINGVKQDREDAISWYKRAAEANDSYGQICLGDCYLHGRGVEIDMMGAWNLYKKAAEQGSLVALYRQGQFYESMGKRNGETAAFYYEKAAEQGLLVAQYKLAVMYDKGEHIAKDSSKSDYWYERAARGGDFRAQWHLARTKYTMKLKEHMRGLGEPDLRERPEFDLPVFDEDMLHVFETAAKRGDPWAQYKLAFSLEFRYYIAEEDERNEDDLQAAAYWFTKAAEGGQFLAAYHLGDTHGVQDTDVRYWAAIAAECECVEAQIQLGMYYEFGIDGEIDIDLALYWYKRAADAGSEWGAKLYKEASLK